jgi:hypothetical protein
MLWVYELLLMYAENDLKGNGCLSRANRSGQTIRFSPRF